MILIYQLSEAGRNVLWKDWKKIKGCGLSHESQSMVTRNIVGRFTENISLGQIEDAWPTAGRELARFAIDHLKKDDWVILYEKEV